MINMLMPFLMIYILEINSEGQASVGRRRSRRTK